MGKPTHHRRDQFRAHGRILRCIQPIGQSRDGTGQDDVAFYTLFRTLDRDDVVQTDGAGLGDTVVHDSPGAIDTANRRSQNDAAVARLAHDRESRPHDMECAHEMHINHRFEVLLRDLFERPVADVTRVVDEDVDAAEVVKG